MPDVLIDRPWTALPTATAGVLRPELPGLADEIVEAISRGVPDYARDLEGPFGKALRAGVEEALRQFVDMVERGTPERGAGREVYVNLGRGEMRAGRSLDARSQRLPERALEVARVVGHTVADRLHYLVREAGQLRSQDPGDGGRERGPGTIGEDVGHLWRAYKILRSSLVDRA